MYNVRKLFIAFALSLASFAGSAAYAADEIGPEDVKVTTPVYHPQFGAIDFPRGTYNYTVSWQGIPAAEASITFDQEGLKYLVDAKARTYSGIDILYKLRYHAEGELSAVDFSPVQTTIEQTENSRVKNTQITYLENGDINAVRSQVGKDMKSVTFDPNNYTLEPFSAALIARSLNWEVGKVAEFDTFNGKTRYLISLKAVEKVTMNVNGVDKDVWVISPSVKNLTKLSPDENKKLREAFIYMTDDKEREILQIVSEVFIGSVVTKLDSFVPSTRAAPGANFAQSGGKRELVF